MSKTGSTINVFLILCSLCTLSATQIAFSSPDSAIQVSTASRGGLVIRSADRIGDVSNGPTLPTTFIPSSAVPPSAFSVETTFNQTPRRHQNIQGYQDYLSRQYTNRLQDAAKRNVNRVSALRDAYFRFYVNQVQSRPDPILEEQQRQILRQSPVNTSPRAAGGSGRRLSTMGVHLSQNVDDYPVEETFEEPFLFTDLLRNFFASDPAKNAHQEHISTAGNTETGKDELKDKHKDSSSSFWRYQRRKERENKSNNQKIASFENEGNTNDAITEDKKQSENDVTGFTLGARIADPPEVETAIDSLRLVAQGDVLGIPTYVMPRGSFIDSLYNHISYNNTEEALTQSNATQKIEDDNGISILIGRKSIPRSQAFKDALASVGSNRWAAVQTIMNNMNQNPNQNPNNTTSPSSETSMNKKNTQRNNLNEQGNHPVAVEASGKYVKYPILNQQRTNKKEEKVNEEKALMKHSNLRSIDDPQIRDGQTRRRLQQETIKNLSRSNQFSNEEHQISFSDILNFFGDVIDSNFDIEHLKLLSRGEYKMFIVPSSISDASISSHFPSAFIIKPKHKSQQEGAGVAQVSFPSNGHSPVAGEATLDTFSLLSSSSFADKEHESRTKKVTVVDGNSTQIESERIFSEEDKKHLDEKMKKDADEIMKQMDNFFQKLGEEGKKIASKTGEMLSDIAKAFDKVLKRNGNR
eukprot:GDKJ01036626.1.p1 GENE.GDKJ01036626.1~~GDKJ01036626.1.p1  ORF type:complete len:695 (-),score=155.29 GDKJ01036626.1:121-2205(-)